MAQVKSSGAIILRRWFWFRLTPKGRSAADYIKIGNRAGYAVDPEDAIYDLPLDAHQRAAPENFPELCRLVLSMRSGEQLGVPQIGLFGTLATWAYVTAALSKKDCRIHDIETGRIFDPADQNDRVEGEELLGRQVNGLKIAPAQEGRKTAPRKGGQNFKLAGERLQAARLAWGTDDDRTQKQIAAEFGVSVPTLWRAMTRNGRRDGEPVGREAAKSLHKQGLWVPKSGTKGAKK